MSAEFGSDDVEKIRDAVEVGSRCIVLFATLAAGHDEPRNELAAWLHREGLWGAVSPKESEFLLCASPTEQQRINATWRAEALWPLLWALGLIAKLSSPQQLCDVQTIRRVLPPLLGPVGEFISSARLRSDTEIQNANEEVYQIHWAVRDARLNGRPVPGGFHPDVVQERHHALNWLIGYWGLDWDDVTTDT